MRVPTNVGFPLRTPGRVSINDIRSTPHRAQFSRIARPESIPKNPLAEEVEARWTERIDGDGKQRKRSVTAATRKEAVNKMNASRATGHESFDTTTTMEVFLADWLDVQRSKVAPTTAIPNTVRQARSAHSGAASRATRCGCDGFLQCRW